MQHKIAEALLEIGAVEFRLDNPVTFRSGMKSPVYVDNRQLPFWPDQWRLVIEGLGQLIAEQGINFDVVAGVAAGGVPHSAALAFNLGKPSVFVRKATKDHGRGHLVEGGDVSGKQVLLVEDMVTTGSSLMDGVKNLRDARAIVEDCISITSYGFADLETVNLYSLVEFSTILQVALEQSRLTEATRKMVEDWFREPSGWAARHGF